MKFTMPTMILLAASMLTVWAADAPQPQAAPGAMSVQVQVLDGAGESSQIEEDKAEVKAFVIRIGPDGKVEFKDALPPDVAKKVREARAGDRSKEEAKEGDEGSGISAKDVDVRGSISVVGPGGLMYSQTFGGAGEASPDVEQLLEKSLEAAGADLPDSVRQALKYAFQQQEQASGAQAAGEGADIAAKLDRILARLEKIEQQIGELKAAEKTNHE